MIILFICFFVALFSCYLLVRFNALHARLSNDHCDSGPQKFHVQPTPRIGGLAIALGLCAAYLYVSMSSQNMEVITQFGFLLVAAIPAFSGGIIEDLTKRVSVTKRLLLSMVSAGIGVWLLGAVVNHLGFFMLDWALKWEVVAVLFTLFAVGGVVNAVNIIDGFNGVVSTYSSFVLLAIIAVSSQLHDVFLVNASAAMLGALLGFFYWNFPFGKIFLGDGGSYLVGFWLAELVLLVVLRHPSVSPWFAALLLIHPVCETLFSIYRRKFLQGKSPWQPDGLHLHTLIFRRLNHIQWASNDPRHKVSCNSMTAMYFWWPIFATSVLAALLWDNNIALFLITLMYVVFYVWLYWRIVRFKAPWWLVKHDRRKRNRGEEGSDQLAVRRVLPDKFQISRSRWLVKRNRRYNQVRVNKVRRFADYTELPPSETSSGKIKRRCPSDE